MKDKTMLQLLELVEAGFSDSIDLENFAGDVRLRLIDLQARYREAVEALREAIIELDKKCGGPSCDECNICMSIGEIIEKAEKEGIE